MEIQDFKKYIDDPVKMQEEDFEKIQSLMEKYPFFHTANLLFIKAAHNIKHEIYNTAISRVSASVPNREMLHELITLKEIKIITKESKEEKPEESQTRKDIREKIQKRRDKRHVEKGDGLQEAGKMRHESLMKVFFEPIFAKLLKSKKDYSVVIERDIVVEEESVTKVETVIDERERKKIEREKRMAEKRRLRAEQTSDEDKEKAKIEKEKKKAERDRRMAEKKRLKEIELSDSLTKDAEKKTPEKEINDVDKKAVEVKSEKKDSVSKAFDKKEIVSVESKKAKKVEIGQAVKNEIVNDEIIIESEIPEQKEKSENEKVINKEIAKDDPYTKIISIPSGDEKEKIISKETKETDIESGLKSIPESKVSEGMKKNKSDDKIKLDRANEREKKDQVIIEDIKIEADINTSKEEGVVIENIYDRIIHSKKPKTTTGKKHIFIEIDDDITGLTPEEEQDDVIETVSEDLKIKEEIKLDKKESDIEINIKSEDKPVKDKNGDVSSEEQKENGLIDIVIDTPKVNEALKQNKKDSDIEISIEKEGKPKKDQKEDVVIDIVSDIPKVKEEKQEKKDLEIIINEDKTDEIEFIIEDTTDVNIQNEETKEEKVEDKTLIEETTEESFELIEKEDEKTKLIDKKEDKNKTEEEITTKKNIETKAANDVLARIAAFKNKKSNVAEVKETKESSELIQKFVEEKPGMKRNEIDDSENEDISVESAKVKKPVITELMASIYINQGKYKQAIEVFEQLILKNPEKKDYFAAKINETEKLK